VTAVMNGRDSVCCTQQLSPSTPIDAPQQFQTPLQRVAVLQAKLEQRFKQPLPVEKLCIFWNLTYQDLNSQPARLLRAEFSPLLA
jgi:hypothetical protein